jgi:capsular polysaccharide biosynthesis protein
MEIKSYFLILARRWRIVLPVFAVTLAATILITLNQPSIYSSSTTYVLAPGTGFEDAWSFAAGLDTLSRQREIATTYTEVATSQTVERQAYEQLGLTQEQKRGVKVSCGLLPGTNIMEITAQGPNPGIARDVANAIGEQTLGYANALYESYVLKPLDEASIAKYPIRPAKKRNIALGGVLGLVLGNGDSC